MNVSRNALCAFLLLALCGGAELKPQAAAAQAKPAPKASAAPIESPTEDLTIPDSVTEHHLTVGGTPIAYTARAGTITLRNGQEQPSARIFYTAYTSSAPAANRPVTFIYNGGPGSSTMWLRMGSIGPVRVLAADGLPSGPAPYRIVDNSYSLIDKSDLVFIDMPDTGFGRIVHPGTPKEFFGVDEDAAAFGQFIQRYLTKFSRWNSPKFLFGESYGTTRSAALANWLLQKGITLNGVVLLSSILSFGLDYGNGDPIGGGDWAYVFYLPTEAATAWYHNKSPLKPDLRSYLNGVEAFAMNEYLSALSRGDRISASERSEVAAKLSGYLGISQQYVRNANLRVSYSRFLKEAGRAQGIVYGRLDGRYQTFDLDRTADSPAWDATDATIDAPYTTAINQYLRNDLGYNPELQYRTNVYDLIYGNGQTWDFSHDHHYPTNVAPDLANAMTQNPKLRVFSANGYYDFATPYFATEYTLKHLQLAPALQNNITYGFYQAGHMIYLNEAALAQYKNDLARWYDSAQVP